MYAYRHIHVKEYKSCGREFRFLATQTPRAIPQLSTGAGRMATSSAESAGKSMGIGTRIPRPSHRHLPSPVHIGRVPQLFLLPLELRPRLHFMDMSAVHIATGRYSEGGAERQVSPRPISRRVAAVATSLGLIVL